MNIYRGINAVTSAFWGMAFSCAAAYAQEPAPQTASPAPATVASSVPLKQQMPELQILVLPGPTGGTLVSMVYATKVPKAKADARANALLQITGWQVADGAQFVDRALESGPQGKKAPIMSSLSFSTNGIALDPTTGTVALEPFLLACRDLSRVHVTFMSPTAFTFRGPRFYSDANIEIWLQEGKGAYTYIANIKNHQAERFHLPQTETAVATPPAKPETARGNPLLLAGILVLALGAGGVAFLLVRRLMQS